ncbi:PREDICTED: F-box protein At5g03100-like [Nicotiana attenuata]|uniref:F-boxlrr-repeat protein n=1 Tax=Nicotiana attenuata TaxID=49451 RepID=A0A1J6KE57_NICAT|nr:PREDICTED: F-box protein At5g03100-like [Nicotiana attenuata]OIT28365.1 putative f-boxlrr-repeat protein [Nicotiana attenuata]
MASSGDCTKNDGSRRSSSNLINPPSSKKRKVRINGAEETLDLLSELPESLLIQILSLLPTKDAFTTCILSKRWQYLWTSVYNFKFTRRSFRKPKHFISFVDYVLAHSVCSKIKRFEIDCTYLFRYNYNSHICRWLSFAVERKLENVVVRSNSETSAFKLPESFCTCSSLITLDLTSCCFDADVVIAWKSVKSIRFDAFVLFDKDILNVLSGCPALETLELDIVEGLRRLEIRSSKLKRLKLQDYWLSNDGGDHTLEIFAPYLQHLEISGDLDDLKCRLIDVSSVVNAKLTFNIRCIKDIRDDHGEEFDDAEDSCREYHQVFRTLVQYYLQKFSCATELTIGTWFTKVLCMLQYEGVQIPELKCKYLTLELHMDKFNLYGVAGLLRALPHVETLVIDIESMRFDYSRCHFESRDLAKGNKIDLQSLSSSFVLPNLKNVMIVNPSGVCLKDQFKSRYVKKLSKLSEFLLTNASVLEKFVIISKKRRCQTCSMNCVSQYLFGFAEKLLGCPKSSTNSVIIFQE